jgi:CRP-like cAMP-binding protein
MLHTLKDISNHEQSLPMKQIHLFDHAEDAIASTAGTIIFEQDQVSDLMYVLIEGEISLLRDGKALAVLTSGTLFGEMAVLEDRPHYATAVAKTDCKLVGLDQNRFRFLVEQTPYFAIDVMTIMAERLQRMNQRMDSLPT